MASTLDELTTELMMLASRFQKSNRRLARALLLSVNELHCMLVLDLERPCCVRKLAESMGASLTATSKILLSLEKGGFVDRNLDPEDHRKERVTLTGLGRAVVARARSRQRPAAERILCAIPGVGRSDLLALMRSVSAEDPDGVVVRPPAGTPGTGSSII